MDKDRCKYCNSEHLNFYDVRGEIVCNDCGLVNEENLTGRTWVPGEFDPGHEDRKPIPKMSSSQEKLARKLNHLIQITNPKSNPVLQEIHRIIDTEFSEELPLETRQLIKDIMSVLFDRENNLTKIRKITGRELHLGLILNVMSSINQFCDLQLPVERFERESGLDSRKLIWLKKRIFRVMISIVGNGYQHRDHYAYRRDQLNRWLTQLISYMHSDEELSRECVLKLKELAIAKLREWGEPLENATTGSRSERFVVKEAISFASGEMNLSSRQKRAIQNNLLGAKRRSSEQSSSLA